LTYDPRVPESSPDVFPPDATDTDGVDRTLIREMLDRTPLERLERLEGFAEMVLSVWERNGLGADR